MPDSTDRRGSYTVTFYLNQDVDPGFFEYLVADGVLLSKDDVYTDHWEISPTI